MPDGETELMIVLGIAAVFISSYFLGRSLNYRRQRGYYRLLADEVRPYAKNITYKSYGPSVISYAFPSLSGKDAPFKKLEVSVALLDRESIIHYVYSKLRGEMDRSIVKADLQSSPSLRFEMLSNAKPARRLAKKLSAEGLRTVKNRSFSEDFLLRSSDLELAEKLLSSMLMTTDFDQVRPYIERLSISPLSPHLLLSYSNEGRYNGLFRFLWDYGKRLNNILPHGSGKSTSAR